MKKVTFAILAVLIWGCAKQSPKTEAITGPELDSIQELVNIAKTAKELTLEDKKAYLKQAEEKTTALSNDSIKLEQLSKISLAYLRIRDSLNFRRTNQELIKLSQNAKSNKVLGYSNWDLALFLQSKGVMDSAMFYYRNALKSFEKMPVDSTSKSLRARMYYGMARVQDSYKDYLGGEISATAAIKIFDDLEDNYRLHSSYNVLGVLAKGLGNTEKSIESYNKALEYLDKSDNPGKNKSMWFIQNNIASVYLNAGDYEKAKNEYLQLINNEKLKQSLPDTYQKALGSFAYTVLKLDNDAEQAEQLLNEAFVVNAEYGDLYDRARLNYYYAEVLAAKKDTLQAIAQAKESFEVAKETYNNDRMLDALRLLNGLDPANSKSYFEEYAQLSDIIKVEERTKRDKFARIRLETDQVIEANQILIKEKQVWIYFTALFITFGIGFLIIISLYVSNSQLKSKQRLQESNQEIYNLMLSQQGKFKEGKQLEQKRISEELHDGILGEMLGIRLILGGLNERKDQASIDQRTNLIEKLRLVEEEIRTISHELNHASYEKFHNFIVSMEDMINEIEKSSGMNCSFAYDKKLNWDNLLGDIKINAYRIVQESLKNCVKHAKSQNVSISFQSTNGKLKLTITDDGVGFDPSRKKKGIGLRNIVSRVKKVKGVLDIDSRPGKGTSISVTMPAKYVEFETTDQNHVVNA
ncbi:ATP-binding protein [Allomuricauda sp. XS_ASV26]|uniref:tetratricopeptide repeat-containing sensor histidine kinase n=1 Tax=Allomuricauda sp. XS_ASV26 TaxID=3241292 RepID=UPI0035132E77